MIEEANRLEREEQIRKFSIGTSLQRDPTGVEGSAHKGFADLPLSAGSGGLATAHKRTLERVRSFSGGAAEHRELPTSSVHPLISPRLAQPATHRELKVDTATPLALISQFHPSPATNPAHVTSAAQPTQPSPSGHLASAIREKEKLDEDVVVIIPSDAPLDENVPSVVTPRSTVSETPSWGADQGGGSDTDSTQSSDVIHAAPPKSIMAYSSGRFVKDKRKGLPIRIPSPGEDDLHVRAQMEVLLQREREMTRERLERELLQRERDIERERELDRERERERSQRERDLSLRDRELVEHSRERERDPALLEQPSPTERDRGPHPAMPSDLSTGRPRGSSAHTPTSSPSPTQSLSSLQTTTSPSIPSTLPASMLFPGAPAGDLSSTTSALAGLPPGAPPLYLGTMPGLLHPGLLSPTSLQLLRGAAAAGTY